MLVLIGVLFLSISFVYAETVEEYFNRGLTHGKQGNFLQAISDFTKAIEIYPKDAEAYYNRGLAYDQQSNFTQATFDFTKAIEINPNDAEAYYNRGLAHYEKKEYDLSWADVHKADELGCKVDSQFLEDLKKAMGNEFI